MLAVNVNWKHLWSVKWTVKGVIVISFPIVWIWLVAPRLFNKNQFHQLLITFDIVWGIFNTITFHLWQTECGSESVISLRMIDWDLDLYHIIIIFYRIAILPETSTSILYYVSFITIKAKVFRINVMLKLS